MTKPKHFNLSSDYATTQNDKKGTITYTIPAGTTVGPGATVRFEVTTPLGTQNAYVRTQGQSSNNSGHWFSGTTFISDANVSLATVGAVAWPLYHTVERTAPTTLHAYCELFNSSPFLMTVTTAQTISWEVVTFLSPFPS